MLNTFRFKTIQSRDGRRRILGLLATTACVVLPGAAFAGDISYVGKGQVATDSSVICTYWMGPGMETPFVMTDGDGKPLSASQYGSFMDYVRFNGFLDRLDGLLWAATPAAQAWLKTQDGQAWRNSDDGKAWVDKFIKGAPADKPVEYVKVCSLYGGGYYYVPGTDICVKLGGYLNYQFDSNQKPKDVTFEGIMDDIKTQNDKAQAEKAKTDSGSSGPPIDPDWLQKATSNLQGSANSTPQTPAQGSGTQSSTTPSQSTTSQTTTSPTSTTSDQGSGGGMTNVIIYVKGTVPEGQVAPPVKEQNIKITFTMPDVPNFNTPRTQQQVDSGASSGAPQGKTGTDGKAKFTIPTSDLKDYGLGYGIKPDFKLSLDYSLTGSLNVKDHSSYYSTEPYTGNAPKEKTTPAGLTYQLSTVTVGEYQYMEIDTDANTNLNYSDEQLKKDITDFMKSELGNDVRIVFEGNLCRVELPGPWVPNYTPVAMKPGEGLPQATIKLNTSARRGGGAL